MSGSRRGKGKVWVKAKDKRALVSVVAPLVRVVGLPGEGWLEAGKRVEEVLSRYGLEVVAWSAVDVGQVEPPPNSPAVPEPLSLAAEPDPKSHS